MGITKSKAFLGLSGSTEDQEIRYTQDGEDPSSNSIFYDGIIEISDLDKEAIIKYAFINKENPSIRGKITTIRIRT